MSVNFKAVEMRRAYSEWPEKVRKAARDKLRQELAENKDFKRSNLAANAILEQVWNAACAASGHDKKRG